MSLHFKNDLRSYISQRDFYNLLENYTNLFGPYRALDVFCDDMYNLLNGYHEECQSEFLAHNAWNPNALWSAMDPEQRGVLMIEA